MINKMWFFFFYNDYDDCINVTNNDWEVFIHVFFLVYLLQPKVQYWYLNELVFFYRCFDRFFKAVNSKEGKLVLKKRVYLMDDVDLIGVDYVWRVSFFLLDFCTNCYCLQNSKTIVGKMQ